MADLIENNWDIRDITITVDGTEIKQLSPGGETGITPSDEQKPKLIDSLKGEIGFSEPVSTAATGSIEVVDTSESISFLDGLIYKIPGTTVQVQMVSAKTEMTGWSTITIKKARISRHAEVKPGKEAGTVTYDIIGYGYEKE